jgi:hypothetical protein
MESSGLLLRPLIGILYQPWMIEDVGFGAIGETNDWQGKLMYLEKTYPSTTLSTTNPTRLEPGSSQWEACD